jgi:hypothetical protein
MREVWERQDAATQGPQAYQARRFEAGPALPPNRDAEARPDAARVVRRTGGKAQGAADHRASERKARGYQESEKLPAGGG